MPVVALMFKKQNEIGHHVIQTTTGKVVDGFKTYMLYRLYQCAAGVR